MIGGNGNDNYDVDSVGDVVTEYVADSSIGGFDTVMSSLTVYTLGNNVENGRIMLTGAANLTGNGLDNYIMAGVGNNVINGGTGNDNVAYNFATAGVKVSLATTAAQATGGSGSDTLISIEGLCGSNFNDQLTGNNASNGLFGDGGNDFLDGGDGSDYLLGGAGNDMFRFCSAIGTDADMIADFVHGEDSVALDDAIFMAIGAPGTLAATAFHTGTAAADADDRVIYNSITGALLYDADGTGTGLSVQFATLSTGLALTNIDFMVI
jgi:Ca2+-binding RTX toxin-like protein